MPRFPDTGLALNVSVSIHDPRRATRVTLQAVFLLSAVLTIVFLVSFIFSEEGISELQSARTRAVALQKEVGKLEEENAALRREIESLDRSTFAVEKIAREELGMSKPGEVVYLLP